MTKDELKVGSLVEVSESNLMTGCFRAEWTGRIKSFLTMPVNMLDESGQTIMSRFGAKIEDLSDKKLYDRLLIRVRPVNVSK